MASASLRSRLRAVIGFFALPASLGFMWADTDWPMPPLPVWVAILFAATAIFVIAAARGGDYPPPPPLGAGPAGIDRWNWKRVAMAVGWLGWLFAGMAIAQRLVPPGWPDDAALGFGVLLLGLVNAAAPREASHPRPYRGWGTAYPGLMATALVALGVAFMLTAFGVLPEWSLLLATLLLFTWMALELWSWTRGRIETPLT